MSATLRVLLGSILVCWSVPAAAPAAPIGLCCYDEQCDDRSSPPVPCDSGNPSTCMNAALCDAVGGQFYAGQFCSTADDCDADGAPDLCQSAATATKFCVLPCPTPCSNGMSWSMALMWPGGVPTYTEFNCAAVPVAGSTEVEMAQGLADCVNNAAFCPGVSATIVSGSSCFDVTVPGSVSPELCVGTAGLTPSCCVPSGGVCSFNPQVVAGSGADCNGNALDDAIDIAVGTSLDVNDNGVPDECEACVPPAPPQMGVGEVPKNRYLSFTVSGDTANLAVRIRFVSLPGVFAMWNGAELWVGEPREVSELSGRTDATPPTTNIATLLCDPRFANWAPSGVVNVCHAGIVPGGRYAVQFLGAGCVPLEANFSASMDVLVGLWGDVAAPYDSAAGVWPAPDGRIDITIDVVSVLEKFSNRPGAPSKPRADVEPALPDQQINITDVTRVLDAFRGLPFPFPPSGPASCGG